MRSRNEPTAPHYRKRKRRHPLLQRRVRRRTACFAAIRTVCTAHPRGILKVGNTRVYVKPILLGGNRYFFFMHFDNLCACYGVDAAPHVAENLFDVTAFAKTSAFPHKLTALTKLFESCYADALHCTGARFHIFAPPSEVTISVPPNAYALCLASLIRLASVGRREVFVSFLRTGNDVRVFVDAVGGKPCPPKEAAMLRILLAEVCAAAGFRLEDTPFGLSLSLCPFDISLLGFKAYAEARYRPNFRTYAEFFR